MFCMNCGKELPDGAKFCDGCGTKVGDVSAVSKFDIQEFDVDDGKLTDNDFDAYVKCCKSLQEYDEDITLEKIDTLKFKWDSHFGIYNREYIIIFKDNEKAFLLLKNCDDCDKHYFDGNDINTWGISSIRNNVKSWITALDKYEKHILEVETEKNVKDKKFLLSQDEVDKYLKKYPKIMQLNGDYWLRSHINSNDDHWADMVEGEGRTQFHANDVSVKEGVRPAMWVKI